MDAPSTYKLCFSVNRESCNRPGEGFYQYLTYSGSHCYETDTEADDNPVMSPIHGRGHVQVL